jgi:acetyl-CoA carboxylase biotin carboxyl carrier protein
MPSKTRPTRSSGPKAPRRAVRPASAALALAAPAAPVATPPADVTAGLDLPLIRELARVVTQHQLSELTLTVQGARVSLRRGDDRALPVTASVAPLHVGAATAAPAPAPAAPAVPAEETGIAYITSPFVGTFYRAPNPEAPPYIEVGARVRKGQITCIVEAMKLMNEIESDLDGAVLEALVPNGQPVEYGQQLFKVKVGG